MAWSISPLHHSESEAPLDLRASMSPLREPGRLGVALLGVVIVLTSAPALVLPLGLIFGAGTLAGWVFVKVQS